MKKRKIAVENSIGKVLPHDMTRIVPGKFKGPVFRKGHIIRKTDIRKFLEIGKEEIWTLQVSKNEYHEDEAAERLKALSGKNVITKGPSEGKVTFIADRGGFLMVDRKAVNRINRNRKIVFTTRHSFMPVKKGETIAGIRIIPLAISGSRIKRILDSARKGKPLNIFPYRKKEVGLIITGSEIKKGKIEDEFRAIISGKVEQYGSRIRKVRILGDNKESIRKEILRMKKSCDFIIITGGMSVDPGDVTPGAIRAAGAQIVSYGAPILPGNMFLAAYLDNIPVFGIPACAVFYKITAFDLFLPMALSGIRITRENIVQRGYGGQCTHCKVCIFPHCSFGKC